MIYVSETWEVNAEQEAKLERVEMRMVRWMCGVSLREKKTNAELRESIGIEKMGHVLRKEGNDWVKSMDMTVEGSRGRGRPKMAWEKVVERDMKVRGLVRNDAKDGVKWRALSWGDRVGKMASKCLLLLLLLFAHSYLPGSACHQNNTTCQLSHIHDHLYVGPFTCLVYTAYSHTTLHLLHMKLLLSTLYILQRAFHSAAPYMNPLYTLCAPNGVHTNTLQTNTAWVLHITYNLCCTCTKGFTHHFGFALHLFGGLYP